MASTNIGELRTVRNIILDPDLTVQQHIDTINKYSADSYTRALHSLTDYNVAISAATKARMVVALWATKNFKEVDAIVPNLLPAEMFKLCQILDAPRKARQLQKKLDLFQAHNYNLRATKKSRIQSEINNYKQDMHPCSLTSSFQKRVKKWVGSFTTEKLDFFILSFAKDPWKELADLAHLKASDFQAPYFLPIIYGGEIPPDSSISAYVNINSENLEKVLAEHPYLAECYSYIRQKVKSNEIELNNTHKRILAQRAPLEDVLWYYEELACSAADEEIATRLNNHEPLISVHGRSNYSKLMERILTFREMQSCFADQLISYADEKLSSIQIPESEQHKVAIFGDCSASMDVAVRVATIIGSLLSVCLKADLNFFNNVLINPPIIPRTANEVLSVTESIRARNATAPAASLYPYYADRKPIDIFIVVTDEEENTEFNGYRFAPLFKKYREEVVPHAQVFFVSFLTGTNEGEMKQSLAQQGITNVKQFRLDGRRPDLSKFDELLGILSMELAALSETKR
ncbi:12390_t:CDS:2 [Ambispora leptoticha]|uniref:12390_t:CDS:1 n=1 Tax=Ambispora leptoticha TaxID=144679 RepID=A0A9N9G8Y1_9GLOM|nr:12390_t:CDS:2 [Ambispora leptoticha]